MFNPEELRTVVSAVVPPGKKNVTMGTVDKNGLQLIWGFKLGENNNWEIQGSFEHTWSGDNNGKVMVLWSI